LALAFLADRLARLADACEATAVPRRSRLTVKIAHDALALHFATGPKIAPQPNDVFVRAPHTAPSSVSVGGTDKQSDRPLASVVLCF
jgi:hypothetical protein